MVPTRIRKALAVFFGFLAPSVLAQSKSLSVYTYYATDLQISPGIIEVSPGYTTVLELFAPVTDQFVGNAGLLDIKTGSNLMVVFPKDRSGETDLVLRTKGMTLLFQVRITEKDSRPRRYVILENRPVSALPQRGSLGLSNPTGTFRDGNVRLSATGRLMGSQAEVKVSFQNLSLDEVVLDPSRLVIRQGGANLDYMAYRKLISDEIPPLETQELQILVREVRFGDLEVLIPYSRANQVGERVLRLTFRLSETPTPPVGIEVLQP